MLSLAKACVDAGVSPVPHDVSFSCGGCAGMRDTIPSVVDMPSWVRRCAGVIDGPPEVSLHLTPAQAAEYGFIASYTENITLVGVRADGRLLVRRSYSR